jgi:hypothetical protein
MWWSYGLANLAWEHDYMVSVRHFGVEGEYSGGCILSFSLYVVLKYRTVST